MLNKNYMLSWIQVRQVQGCINTWLGQFVQHWYYIIAMVYLVLKLNIILQYDDYDLSSEESSGKFLHKLNQ